MHGLKFDIYKFLQASIFVICNVHTHANLLMYQDYFTSANFCEILVFCLRRKKNLQPTNQCYLFYNPINILFSMISFPAIFCCFCFMTAELLNKNQRRWKLSHSGQAIKKQEHELIKSLGIHAIRILL